MSELFSSEIDLINALLRQVSQEKPQMRSARPSDPGVIYNPREAERQAYQEAVQSGDILGAPIPGSNPEVGSLEDAMLGVLMGGGGMVRSLGRTSGGGLRAQKPPANRQPSYRRSGEEMGKAMGMSARGMPFAEQEYKHIETVKITWPDGMTHIDQVKGLNRGHALQRARANWPDASFVESYSGPVDF